MFKEAAGQTMPERMRTGFSSFEMNSCPEKVFMYQCANCSGSEFCIRWLNAYEDVIGFCFWPRIFQIVDDSLAHIRKERQFQRISGFNLSHSDSVAFPVDIRKSQICNITASKAQPGNQQDNGIVSDSAWISHIDCIQCFPDLVFCVCGWKPALPVVVWIGQL